MSPAAAVTALLPPAPSSSEHRHGLRNSAPSRKSLPRSRSTPASRPSRHTPAAASQPLAATGGGGAGGAGSAGGSGGGGSGGFRFGPGYPGGDENWPMGGLGLASMISVTALDLANARQASAGQHPHCQQRAGRPVGLASLAAAVLLAGASAVCAAAVAGRAEAHGGSPGAGVHKAEVEEEAGAASGTLEASPAQPAAAPKRIVLFVEPSPFTYTSGYQTRFLATIREMVAAGCQVLVVTPGRGAGGLLPGGQQQPEAFEGARVVEAGSFPCPGYSSVPLSLGLSPRIYSAVSGWKPDLIHCTSPGALPIAAWIYSRMLRVPLVASFHTHVPTYLPKMGLGWLEGGIWGLIRATHRAADLTIAVSHKTAADLVAAGACDPHTVKVWPKAVDCQRFHPAHASREMRRRLEGGHRGAASGDASDASGPLLLFVGRVSSEKNLELLREVLERVPGGRLAVVGDGPAMEDMRRHFAGTRTTFLGFLRGRQLAAAYASADFFVFPSESETLGNVVGEAMASGLPVVAAAAGGVPSVVARPGEAGILFPPGNAEAAAAAIRRLAASPDARRRMSQAARAEMERWSWRHATAEILQDHYPAAVAAAAGLRPSAAAA